VFKRGLLSLALGMVALTIATAMFEGFEVPESARSEAPAEAIQLPPFAERLLAFWDFLAVFIAGFIAIYIGLSARSHLPRETIKGNLLHVGVASAALFAMHTILVLAAMLIGQLPMAGGIYAMLLGLARLALAYYILERLLDVDFTDFLLAFVIYLLLRFIVMDIVRIGIATALYHATT
jgi:hypothetical protein